MKKVQKTKRIYSRKTLIIGAILVIALIGASTYAYHSLHKAKVVPKPVGQTSQGDTAGVNFDPPTTQDKQAVDSNKQSLPQETSKPSSPPANKKFQVTPVITNATANVVNGYVSGVFEDDGTCTATFTLADQHFVKTSSGFQNATNTGCAPIKLSRSDFPSAGKWAVVLSYSSSKSEGASQSVAVEVQ